MGHLDNTERVIEARLTSLGRRRLAEGEGIDITQFALADDEVDYRLWQEDLPEEDKGAIIENLPTYEAFTDETQSMRYKLVSLESNSDNIPNITIDSDLREFNIDQQNTDNPISINPSTDLNGSETGLDSQLGYTAILQNKNIVDLDPAPDSQVPESDATIPALFGRKRGIGSSQTRSVRGSKFEIRWNASNLSQDEQTTITVIGNETGLSLEIVINVISL